MKDAVRARKMPPWFADPKYVHFLNDRSLTQSEISIIGKWADGGALEGHPKNAPPSVRWPEGWQVQPDIVIQGPTTNVPADAPHHVNEWISNPNPNKTIYYGEMTWEEMMVGFFGVVIDRNADPGNIVAFSAPAPVRPVKKAGTLAASQSVRSSGH